MAIYATPITLIMSSITAWRVQIYPYLAEYGYDFHLWEFLLFIMVGFLIGGFLEWKFSVPSFFRAWTHSFYTEDNPLRQDIEEIKERLAKIEHEKTASGVSLVASSDRNNGGKQGK